MADLKKVSTKKLKDAVDKIAPQLPEEAVVIVGARQVKDGQVEVEFLQNRSLNGSRVNVLAALNEGDKRFNNGRQTMRVWSIVSALGFNNTFPTVGVTLEEVKAACEGLEAEQRVSILTPVTEMKIAGKLTAPKIVVLETIDKNELPKAVREVMDDAEAPQEYKDRYILQTKEGVKIVDTFGNTVYRVHQMDVIDRPDVLVEGKQLITDFNNKKANAGQTTNVLQNAHADLAD